MLLRICTSSSRSPEYSVAHDSVGLPPVNTIVVESTWVKDDICHFGFNHCTDPNELGSRSSTRFIKDQGTCTEQWPCLPGLNVNLSVLPASVTSENIIVKFHRLCVSPCKQFRGENTINKVGTEITIDHHHFLPQG